MEKLRQVVSEDDPIFALQQASKIKKVGQGVSCVFFFLDYRYLQGVAFFFFLSSQFFLAFCFRFVLPQCVFFCLFPHCSASGHVYVANNGFHRQESCDKRDWISLISTTISTTKGAYRERDLRVGDEGIATPLYYQLLFFLESHLVKSNELWLWVVNGVYGGWCIIENNICG